MSEEEFDYKAWIAPYIAEIEARLKAIDDERIELEEARFCLTHDSAHLPKYRPDWYVSAEHMADIDARRVLGAFIGKLKLDET